MAAAGRLTGGLADRGDLLTPPLLRQPGGLERLGLVVELLVTENLAHHFKVEADDLASAKDIGHALLSDAGADMSGELVAKPVTTDYPQSRRKSLACVGIASVHERE